MNHTGINSKHYFILYIIIGIAYLFFSLLGNGTMTFYLKPLLMPALMAATYVSYGLRHKNLLLYALFFCWLGDIFLLFAGIKDLYFILGLVAFLLGHLIYIVLFRQYISSVKLRAFPILIIILYLIIFLFSIGGSLGNMLAPVILYSIVIAAMLYFAILAGMEKLSGQVFLLISGTIAFVISDNILAVNKFHTAIPYSGFLIMSTYVYAQGAIVAAFSAYANVIAKEHTLNVE